MNSCHYYKILDWVATKTKTRNGEEQRIVTAAKIILIECNLLWEIKTKWDPSEWLRGNGDKIILHKSMFFTQVRLNNIVRVLKSRKKNQ